MASNFSYCEDPLVYAELDLLEFGQVLLEEFKSFLGSVPIPKLWWASILISEHLRAGGFCLGRLPFELAQLSQISIIVVIRNSTELLQIVLLLL